MRNIETILVNGKIDSANRRFVFDLSEDELNDLDIVLRELIDIRHGKDARLACGVGNDMSYAFYVRDSSSRVRFYPDGIKGEMFLFRKIQDK